MREGALGHQRDVWKTIMARSFRLTHCMHYIYPDGDGGVPCDGIIHCPSDHCISWSFHWHHHHHRDVMLRSILLTVPPRSVNECKATGNS